MPDRVKEYTSLEELLEDYFIQCNEATLGEEDAITKEFADKLHQLFEREEFKLRALLWASHACDGKYADDGELRCGRFLPPIDFKRDSPEEIERKTPLHYQQLLREEPKPELDDGELPEPAPGAIGIKPDRLLTIREQCCEILIKYENSTDEKYGFDAMLDDVIAKTASIKEKEFEVAVKKAAEELATVHKKDKGDLIARMEAECQERVKRIFGEIENTFSEKYLAGLEITEWWQALKKQGGINE